jgi:hypothetical protein
MKQFKLDKGQLRGGRICKIMPNQIRIRRENNKKLRAPMIQASDDSGILLKALIAGTRTLNSNMR